MMSVSFSCSAMKNGIVAAGMGWELAATLLVLLFVFSHYVFASTTAHISAIAFLTVGRRGAARLCDTDPALDGGRLEHHDDTDALRHRHLAHHLRKRLCAVGELIIYAVLGTTWWRILGLG